MVGIWVIPYSQLITRVIIIDYHVSVIVRSAIRRIGIIAEMSMTVVSSSIIRIKIIIIKKNCNVCQHVVHFVVSVDFVIVLGVCQSAQRTRLIIIVVHYWITQYTNHLECPICISARMDSVTVELHQPIMPFFSLDQLHLRMTLNRSLTPNAQLWKQVWMNIV